MAQGGLTPMLGVPRTLGPISAFSEPGDGDVGMAAAVRTRYDFASAASSEGCAVQVFGSARDAQNLEPGKRRRTRNRCVAILGTVL